MLRLCTIAELYYQLYTNIISKCLPSQETFFLKMRYISCIVFCFHNCRVQDALNVKPPSQGRADALSALRSAAAGQQSRRNHGLLGTPSPLHGQPHDFVDAHSEST